MKKATRNTTKRYRILRSCLCLALVLTLALGHIVPISVAKAADSADTELSADTGGETTGWTKAENLYEVTFEEEDKYILGKIKFNGTTRDKIPEPGYAVVDDPANGSSDTNKCLKMITDQNVRRITWGEIDTTKYKQVVYEFSLSADPNEYVPSELRAVSYTLEADDHLKLNGSTTEKGKAKFEIGEETVVAGKWTKVYVAVDYTKRTYTIWTGESDTPVAVDKPIPSNASYMHMRIDAFGSKQANSVCILIDDLKVYEGNQPREEVVWPDDLFTLDFSETEEIIRKGINKKDGSTASEYGNYYTVVNDPTDSSNKCLRMGTKEDVYTRFKWGDTIDTSMHKQVVYEYKLSVDPNEKMHPSARIWVDNGGFNTLLYLVGGEIKSSTSATAASYGTVTAEKWTKISIAADHSDMTYDLYVDDELMREDVTLTTTPLYYFRFTAGEGYGHILIDDLRIYEGTKPHEMQYDSSVGKNVYVNRTFDEVYMYDLEELEALRNASTPVVVKDTDGNKYLKLDVKDANAASSVAYIISAESNWIIAQAKVRVESGTDNDGVLFAGSDAENNAVTFLKIVDNSVQLSDGTEVDVLTADTFKDIAVALNVVEKKFDVYVDGVKKMEAVEYTAPANFAQITTTMENGNLLVDDLRVYDAKSPKIGWVVNNNPETIYLPNSFAENLLGNAVAIQLNANILYTPATGKVDATKKFDLSEEGKVYLAQADIEKLFGTDTVLGDATVKDGMYDVIAVAKNSGYTYVHEMENRMFIFSKLEITLLNPGDAEDAKTGNEREVNLYLQFERPTAERIKELFEIAGAKNEHPRILITQEDVDNLKRLYNSGHELVKKWGDETIAVAEEALLTKDFTYKLTGTEMADVDATRPMILNLGMAWLLTGDQRYADKAWRMAEIICNLPHWNPAGYLDIGEFCVLVGVVYDWFYDILSEEQKLFLEEAILEKGVSIQQKIYYKDKAPEGVYWGWWNNANNFNPVCNGGTMVGAVVLFDKYPDVCAQVISNSMRGLERMMKSFYPDGAWFEGPNYWRYTLAYLSYTMMTFENAFGDDFGILCSPGFEKTGWFGLSLTGSTGSYNYGDANPNFISNTHALWCATLFDDAELMAARLLEMEKMGITASAHELLYFSEALYDKCGEVELSLDTEIRGNAIVSMKEKWFDTNATWLAANGMIPKSNHGHLDTGSFAVDMLGERLIIDIGANDYQADGYFSTKRYHYYRTRPEGHNLYVINPLAELDDYGGFAPWVDAQGSGITATAEGAYYTIDLSDVYAEDTESAIRGYMLMDDRRNVMIRDEITFKEGTTNTFYSFFHTKADVEIVDQNTAVLTQNGKKYKVTMATNAENYTFSVVAAEPMFDIHKLSGSSDNTGISKLQFFTDSASGNLTFTLRITAYDDPAADKTAADLHDVALAQWDTLLTQDGEITVLPTLDMIYVNGEELANFNPDTTGYTGQLSSSAMLPVVTASSETYERIEVIPATDFGKDYVIKVYDNKDENIYRVYRLSYTRIPELEPIDGRVRYPIAGGTQSSVNEIAPNGDYLCTIDNDFTVNSRWGAQGNAATEQWLMLELDEVSTVHKIGLSFSFGQRRYMHFKLEVSVDGENWTTVYDGLSTELQTNELNTELQYFYDSEEGVPAKFVRYSGPGGREPNKTAINNYWHHINEFVVLGPKEVTEYYEQGSNEALEMIYSGTLESVKLGEETVAAENYTVTAGNASVLSLKPEYLDALTAGSYELTMNYADGTSAVVTLEILPVGASAVQIIPEGTVGSYEQKSGENVSIHASGIPEELVGVMVNGDIIGTSSYVVTEGSTIVTFKNEYLDTLTAGEYKVELLYSGNRSVETTLTIAAQTGDDETTEGAGDDETTEGAGDDETTEGAGDDETTEGAGDDATTEGAGDDETTEGAGDDTTTEGAGDDATTGGADGETTGAVDESTEADESTEVDESTEAETSTETGTNAIPGGDPDTGDMSSAGRLLWLFAVATVVMTGYALAVERKKQK